jgi:COMPASS component SWD2
LIDAFNGEPINSFVGHQNKNSIPVEASFSPDSKYVISGSNDSRIHGWNIKSGSKVCILESYYNGPINCVKFNPKYMMIASTSTNMEFWLPKYNFI